MIRYDGTGLRRLASPKTVEAVDAPEDHDACTSAPPKGGPGSGSTSWFEHLTNDHDEDAEEIDGLSRDDLIAIHEDYYEG